MKFTLMSINNIKGVMYSALLLFFSTTSVSAISTDTLTYKGNVFVVKNMADTVTMLNQQSMEVETIINNPSPIPVKMNGLDIYGIDEVQTPPGITESTLKFYILNKLGKQITGAGDGIYRMVLNSVVIDVQGRVVYYDFIGIEKRTRKGWLDVPALSDEVIAVQIENVFDGAPVYTPAMLSGAKVACRLSDEEFQQPFQVERGSVYPVMKK